jgi:hypothetical protein
MTGPGSYNKDFTKSKVVRIRQFVDTSPPISAKEFAKSIGVDSGMFYKWCEEYGIKFTRRGRHAKRA